MVVHEIEVKSLDEITDAAKSCGESENHRFYRGQVKDWPLISSLGRMFRGVLIPTVEEVLMSHFQQAYSRQYETMARDHRDATQFIVDLGDENQWHTLAVAQHYGLPTRLLDWSKSIRVAAYFAVRGEWGADQSDGMIYVFHDRTGISPANAKVWPELTLKNVRPYRAWQDEAVNRLPRLQQQQGAFTVQPDPENDMISQLNRSEHCFLKLRIPKAWKKSVRSELEILDVNEFNLFGGIDSLCKEISLKILGRFPKE